MKTTCAYCLFSIKQDGKQTGCAANRLDIFKKEYFDNHYVLEGYCNLCRNETWEHKDKSLEEQLKLAHEETAPNFEFILCHHENDDEIKTQIQSILDLNLNISEIIVVTDNQKFQILYNDLYNQFEKSFIRVVFAYNSKDELSKILEILTKRQKTDSLYRVVLGQGGTIKSQTFIKALELWKELKVMADFNDKCLLFCTQHTKNIIGHLLRDEHNNNKL